MGREPPKTIPDLKDMAAIRAAINRCVKTNDCRSVTALLRIRREEHYARPLNRFEIISLGVIFPVCLSLFAFSFRTVATYVLVAAGTVVWVAMMAHYWRRYPHRDEKDLPERQEIDGMVRMGLDRLCESARLEELELDDEDKRDILELYAGEKIPVPLNHAILKATAPEPLPDI